MAPKLGFLIVDDRYSKSRIGSLLFGMFSVAILPNNFNEYFTYIEFFNQPILINVFVTFLIVVTALIPDFLLIVYESIKKKLQRVKKVIPD